MRNLKKVLALVLALVMSMSLVTIANAADFSDDADINYKEAVDVMNAIGVIDGLDTGAFNPNGTLTREQAAKIIATMMLGSGADKLGTTSSSFKDVAATRWSSPYIEYCASIGIIAGNGDGTYNPTGKLTGHAFAKMLLGALGYNSQYEGYTGAGWSVEVAKDAVTAGITVDGVAMSAQLTREQAAQMAFQTLKATMVEYKTAGSSVVLPDGTQIVTTGSTASKVENSNTKAGYDGEKDGYQQFCEEYFSDLKVNTNSSDAFGAPSDKWTYKNSSVGTYAQEANATYTEEVNSKTLYSDLDLDKTTKADVITDGKADGTFPVQKGNTSDKIGGNGVAVNAYVDDDNNVTLVVINSYVGEVSKVTDAKDGDEAYVTVDGMKYETESFEKDDVVVYTKVDNEIQTMALAEKVEGVEVSRVNGTTSFVADGNTYKFNSNITFSSDVKVDSVLDLYLDAYGYVMKVDVSKASSDYAYVIDVGADEGRYSDDANYYAKMLLSDGTQVEASVDEDCLTGSDFETKKGELENLKGDIVEYSKDSKDMYTLTSKADSKSGKVEIKKGESGMNLGGTSNNYYANSKTIFLVQSGTGSKATYASYTGYANVPSMSKDTGATYTVFCKSGTVATMVFVSGVSTTSDDIVYVLASKDGVKVNDSDAGTYYEYKAVVNGEITTVKMDEEISGSADVLYSSISYADKENEILDTAACEAFSTDKTDDSYALENKMVTAEPEDDIIGIASENYALSSDAEYYAVTSGDKIEAGSSADLEKDKTSVTAIVKNGEIVTIFYGVDGGSTGGSTGSGAINGADERKTSNLVVKGDYNSTVANQKAYIKDVLDDGIYVFDDVTFAGLGLNGSGDEIGGNVPTAKDFKTSDIVTFKYTAKEGVTKATLYILDKDGTQVYTEVNNSVTAGGNYFVEIVTDQNDVAAEKPWENAGTGAMKNAPLENGDYTYRIVCSNGDVFTGSFSVR